MGKHTSIFQEKIYAIYRCGSFNLVRNYGWQNIVILSDCPVAIKALMSNQVNSELVWECLNNLNMCGSLNNVWILWVASHVRLKRNEAVDELVRKGLGFASPLHLPEPFCGVENGFITKTLRKTGSGGFLQHLCHINGGTLFEYRTGHKFCWVLNN